MVVEATLPTLTTVIFTAAIDSINPCAIGVLIMLISTVIATSKTRAQMLKLGIAYIAAVYITYLAAGLFLLAFFTSIPQYVVEYIAIIVGGLIALAGLIEFKDFFWYGQGFSLAIDPGMSKKISGYAKNLSIPGVMFLGAFVAAVELPCTGAPYLAILLVLKGSFDLTALLLLLLYNLIFILPLLIILGLAVAGMKVTELKMWKDRNRPYMRLLAGLLFFMLGWLLIFIANGTINFG